MSLKMVIQSWVNTINVEVRCDIRYFHSSERADYFLRFNFAEKDLA